MKKILGALFVLFGFQLSAQNILIVNDNDLIAENTDSILAALDVSIYSDYSFWNIPDSTDGPSSAFMSDFDCVVWYCSTDGASLKLWDGSTSGNAELVDFIISGKPLWIIGVDALYEQYGTAGDAFASGEFAYDFMGLSSYDVQSYGDDGSLGVSQVDRLPSAPAYFPNTLTWIFATHWWVDGVTGRTGAINMYEMGPAGYALAGSICQIHFEDSGNSVMSTFFDPALVGDRGIRRDFLESGITYLLPADIGTNEIATQELKIYPNPASTTVKIELPQEIAFADVSIHNSMGQLIGSYLISNLSSELLVADLPDGFYYLNVTYDNSTFSKAWLIIQH